MNKSIVLNLVSLKPNVLCIENNFKKSFNDIYNDLITWSFPDYFKFSQKLYHYFNDDKKLKLGKCIECGKQCSFRGFIRGYSKYCSNKCSNNSLIWKKMVSCKHKETNHQIEMNKKHIENVNKKLMKKYPFITSISNDRIYTCKCLNQSCNMCIDKKFEITCGSFRNRMTRNNELCTKRNPIGFYTRVSNEEKTLYEFIKSIYKDKIIKNDRKELGNQLELDIYLPKINIAFEYQGDIWHANPIKYDESFICPLTGRTYKEIHEHDEYKYNLAKSKGIEIIYVWENDWMHNRDSIKEKIMGIIN